MTMNRTQRRQAGKDLQARLKDEAFAGAVDLAEIAQGPKKVSLAYLVDQYVTAEFLRSVLAVGSRSTQFGFVVRSLDVEVSVERPKARNMLLKNFLEGSDDYLLFVETDIAFAPQDVAMLIAADAPIAGALYFTAATGAESWPTAWVKQGETEGDGTANPATDYVPVQLPTPPEDLLPTYEVTEDMSAEDKAEADRRQQAMESWLAVLSLPIPVAGVGFGLALIRRDAAQQVADAYEWPFEAVQDQREDLTFCLRSAQLDLQTVVVPAARVGHVRSRML